MGYDSDVRFACLAGVLAVARPALADRAAADKLADTANALAKQGKLAEAAAAFRTAYTADPRPQLICNAGVAYYKASDLPRAAYYLEQCRAVGGQLDAAFLDNVDKVLAAVRQVLGARDFTPVTIIADPATASVAIANGPIDEPIVGAHTVWLPFGNYRVHVHEDGYVDRDEPVSAADHTPITMPIKLAPRAVEPPKPEPPAPQSSAPPARVHSAPATPRARSRVPAIAATAGTVALGALAGVAYLHAVDLNDQADKTHDYTTYKSLRTSTLDYKHLSWAVGGLAGAGAIVSGLLWVRGFHVETAPDQITASIAGTF